MFPLPYPVSRWCDEKGGTESLYEGRIIMYSIFSQHGNALERRFRGELLRIEPWGEKSFRVRATCLPQLPAGLNMGLAGIPWWTTDIGVFLGGNPDDPTAWDIQDEYLLGGDVLVAPILFEGQRSRRVYLPGKGHLEKCPYRRELFRRSVGGGRGSPRRDSCFPPGRRSGGFRPVMFCQIT